MLLGIDVGGTKIAYAVADDAGHTLVRWRRPTEPSGSAEQDVARIAADARRLLANADLAPAELRIVGVSVPGPLDRQRGLVMHPPNVAGWGEVPLVRWLGEALGCEVALENDANAAALAEWRFGAGQGLSDIVYLTMSTGVGAGLILGGRLYRGQHGTAGELGHAPIEWGGERCACGLRGCLEAYVGGAALARRLQSEAPESSLALELAGSREALGPVALVAAAARGDAFALSEMERWNDYLARAIVQLAFGLAPQAVILGTIAVAAGEALCFEPLRRLVARHCWPHQAPYMRIEPAALGEELPYRAGVCVALEALQPA